MPESSEETARTTNAGKRMDRQPKKVFRRRWSVNRLPRVIPPSSCAARVHSLLPIVIAVMVAACGGGPRPVDLEPPQEFAWPTVQGDVGRAGHAAQIAPEQEPEVIWRSDVGRGLRSELLVLDDVVLVAASNRLLAAYSAESGRRYWERRLDGSIRAGLLWRADTIWTATENRGGIATALELRDGSSHWTRDDVGVTTVPPLLDDDLLVVGTVEGYLRAIDAADGTQRWAIRLPGGIAATPVRRGEHVLVPTRLDSLYAVARADGHIDRRLALPGEVSAAPASDGERLYLPLHTGELLVLDLESLEEEARMNLGAPILAPPVVSPDGTIYALTSAADVWRIPAGASEPEPIAELGGAARAALTLARDRLLVGRLDGTLFLLRTDGDVVWEVELDGSIFAPVSLRDGAIYVPLLGGSIAKLR